MSGHYENLPFRRGATYGATATTEATHLEGREFLVEDNQYGTNLLVRLRICRNNSGAAIAGKRLVQFDATAGTFETSVAGYARLDTTKAYVADDLLVSCPDKDLFYVVVEGPCLVKTSLEGGATNLIAYGDRLHALTAATTGATTAGRVQPAVLTGATAVLAAQVDNLVGKAMSAKTTAQTNGDVLIHAGRF